MQKCIIFDRHFTNNLSQGYCKWNVLYWYFQMEYALLISNEISNIRQRHCKDAKKKFCIFLRIIPPNESRSNLVSFESRNGTCELSSANALMHLPNALNDRLIDFASSRVCPSLPNNNDKDWDQGKDQLMKWYMINSTCWQ